jgi:hypothetical protein
VKPRVYLPRCHKVVVAGNRLKPARCSLRADRSGRLPRVGGGQAGNHDVGTQREDACQLIFVEPPPDGLEELHFVKTDLLRPF